MDLERLRERIGFVTQDTQLFSGTIRENLLFVRPGRHRRRVPGGAAASAACQSLLARADKGLDTVIGEGGIKVSGGERQRLSIARALLRRPDLLVFDEATSSLDSLTEEEISRTIRDVAESRDVMTILIAHRLSTVMHADRIYVLERGQVVETGRHEELLDRQGLYYAMWRQQVGERRPAAAPARRSRPAWPRPASAPADRGQDRHLRAVPQRRVQPARCSARCRGPTKTLTWGRRRPSSVITRSRSAGCTAHSAASASATRAAGASTVTSSRPPASGMQRAREDEGDAHQRAGPAAGAHHRGPHAQDRRQPLGDRRASGRRRRAEPNTLPMRVPK